MSLLPGVANPTAFLFERLDEFGQYGYKLSLGKTTINISYYWLVDFDDNCDSHNELIELSEKWVKSLKLQKI